MDRLDCDRMFLAVYESGGFSRAAKRLETSAGQASKLVTRLENELGVQLFHRTTRALSPTEVGRAYYERLKGLIEEFDALDASVRSASGRAAGRIALTVPMSFGSAQLAPALVAFAEAYPEIQLEVSFSDRLANLVDEGFDAAVRIGDPQDSSLIARKLCPMRIVVCAATAYLAKRGFPAGPAALADHECIIDTNFRDPSVWRFRSPEGEPLRTPVQGRLRFSNPEACIAAAVAGLGVARVPSFIAGPRLAKGELTQVLGAFELQPSGLFVVYPPGRHRAARVRALVDFLSESFRGVPAWDQGW